MRRFHLLVVFLFFAGVRLNAQPQAPDLYKQLKFRYIGPEGNRVIAVAGEPGNPNVYYAGAASGGIFKSEDGGSHWKPIFDDQPVSSIGSLAIAPSDHQIVWAGTGETFIRSNISLGNGIYKSTDGGKSWKHMGLTETGRIGRVLIHPANPDVVYAAAMGHSYGPQPDRGLFRTTDGGTTWKKVLFVDENTGCSDIAMDPNNPRILLAGTWQLEIHTWGRTSGGPGSGLHLSKDGGETWKRLQGSGLPKLPVGKVAVGIAPSDSNRFYALIETADGVPSKEGEEVESGELWRSDDAGESWKLVSYDRNLAGRTHYYSRFAIAPDDENEVYFLSAAFSYTLDGGETIKDPEGDAVAGGDNHDMWIDPADSSRRVVSHDGGLSISVNGGRNWTSVELPIAQMYHVAVDNDVPYNVYGNRQDGPSTRGPSNSRLAAGFFGEGRPGPIPRSLWHSVGGGESGFAIPDPVDSDIVWATASGLGSVGGIVDRYNEKTRQVRRVEIWPDNTVGWSAEDLEYRFQWTFPLAMSPHDRNTIYAGSQMVHRTRNGGQSWERISSDLTLNDKERQLISGGLNPDNVGVEYAGVVFAIAESPLEKGTIWAGTNDGRVHVSRNDGASWTDVTAGIPNLPPWGTVSNIEPSRHSAGTAYVTVDFHQVNNRDPFVYQTADYGRSWKSIGGGVPRSPLSYAHCLREDPVRKGLLYLGVENALYVSFDDGEKWLPLQNNLPHAPVHWMAIQENFHDLVVATYGRGFWILDDITPLRQLDSDVLKKNAQLMAPRAAYRFIPITEPMMDSDDQTSGTNPPYGASLNYFLKTAPEDQKAEVKLVIKDAKGETVRTLDGTKEAGINRVWWDLTYEPSTEIKLRTKPVHASWVKMGEDGTRPYPGFGGRVRVLVPPGTYSVTLKAAGEEMTQSLEVRKDPNSEGAPADIETQTARLLQIRDDLNAVVDMIHRLEWTRKQLYDLKDVQKEDEAIVKAIDELDQKLLDVEENLHETKVTGRGQDALRWPSRLVFKLAHLANGIGTADFAPTDQQIAVHEMFQKQIRELKTRVDGLLETDLGAFNAMLREKNIANVVPKGS